MNPSEKIEYFISLNHNTSDCHTFIVILMFNVCSNNKNYQKTHLKYFSCKKPYILVYQQKTSCLKQDSSLLTHFIPGITKCQLRENAFFSFVLFHVTNKCITPPISLIIPYGIETVSSVQIRRL